MRRTTVTLAVAACALLDVACSSDRGMGNPTAPGATEPNLSVASNGDIWMSWLERADSVHVLRVASFDGSEWSAARDVRAGNDFFVNWADFPSVQPLGDGRLAVHWLQRAGNSTYAYHVKVAFSNDRGATWSDPVTLHRDTSATEHGFVTLWSEGNSLGAAWLDGRKYGSHEHDASNEMMVASTAFDASGRRGAEVVLDGRSCDCCQNASAVTSSGPVVAYRNRSADEIRDIYLARRVNGAWLEGKPVHDDNWHIAACPVNGPGVSANGNRVAVAWFTAASDSPRVNVAFSTDAGGSFGSPVRVDDGAPAGRVDVELLDDGSALVSWIERVGGDTAEVRARRIAADGAVGAPVTVATSSAARASGFPRMAVSGDHAMFAWTVPGTPSAVRLARLPVSDFR